MTSSFFPSILPRPVGQRLSHPLARPAGQWERGVHAASAHTRQAGVESMRPVAQMPERGCVGPPTSRSNVQIHQKPWDSQMLLMNPWPLFFPFDLWATRPSSPGPRPDFRSSAGTFWAICFVLLHKGLERRNLGTDTRTDTENTIFQNSGNILAEVCHKVLTRSIRASLRF